VTRKRNRKKRTLKKKRYCKDYFRVRIGKGNKNYTVMVYERYLENNSIFFNSLSKIFGKRFGLNGVARSVKKNSNF